ncbi:putative phage abortive infection protein [Pseudomonas oryzihabitans]|uniref:putative phage abortive infection protein n=1 Tax=Pseudomonas oryzihabitans TaxID=47885 RepID=UPI0028944B01|nr:putative phage abortive infection protein [Pseudomonas oryzihabitans]MDT3719931.1 putative phage abortive infection protein [Pseudomonas oryzihabitans]
MQNAKLRLQHLALELKKRAKYRAKLAEIKIKDYKRHLNPSLAIFTFSIAAVISATTILYIEFKPYLASQWLEGKSIDPEKMGQAGDFFGGFLNPLLSFIALMAVLYTVRLQRKELNETREEYKAANKIQAYQTEVFERQNFESVLFRLMEIHKLVADELRGFGNNRNCQFKKTSHLIKQQIKNSTSTTPVKDKLSAIFGDQFENNIEQQKFIKELYDSHERANIKAHMISCAENILKKDNGGAFDHYFRNMFQILKTIDNYGRKSTQSQKRNRHMNEPKTMYFEKRRYASMLRAQLQQPELEVIFFNCLTQKGRGLKYFVEKYSILKHINFEFISHNQDQIDLFHKFAYNSSEEILKLKSW